MTTYTGYFANGERGGKVHLAEGGYPGVARPLCGVRLGPKAEFQWCANGVWVDYLECARCRRKALERAARQARVAERALGRRRIR